MLFQTQRFLFMKNIKILAFLFLLPIAAFSQKPDSSSAVRGDSLANKMFKLGEVVVTASRLSEITERVTQRDMELRNLFDVPRAMEKLPGISISASGARNETTVSVRGFDLRAVPVYMDGIPVYVPYDGYVDLSRFTAFDLSAVDVSKGFSSVVYGPNSLGGAINLISRKPFGKFEYDCSAGLINSDGYRGAVNIGSNYGNFYFQGGASYLHRDSYLMSKEFQPHNHENGGNRKNSYRTDQKINLKIGWMPNEKSEYVVGYINQQGKKGNPVYAGDDKLNSLYDKPRYWQWPYWNKETYYFLSNSSLGDDSYIKSRVYYDIFKNSINSFDDSTYTTQKKPYAFQSMYNDYSYGGSLEYGTSIFSDNKLKLSAQYKEDIHRENNAGEPIRRFEDNTLTFAAEDTYKFSDNLEIIPGVIYSIRKNITAEDYNGSSKTVTDFPRAQPSPAFNLQLGVFYYLNENHNISATASRKTRFATLKERYSYRMGTAIPNPKLNPEIANNYDLTYTGNIVEKLTCKTSLFYSRLKDAIIGVSNVLPGKSQMQNTGEAEFAGIELSAKYDVAENIRAEVNYSYIERNNLTDPSVLFTDIPNTKVYFYLQYNPVKQIGIIASAEYNSLRYSTSYGTKSPEFTVISAIISGQVLKNINIKAGINNIFDNNYSLTEGYPEEGRNFFLTIRFFGHNI